MEYVKVRDVASGSVYILMGKRLEMLYPELKNEKKKKEALKKFEELERFKGEKLKGLEYSPPFDYFESTRETGSFKVITGTWVTDDSGTGIVHCAPAFGEEDYKACISNGVVRKGQKLVCPLDANGRFTDEVPEFQGRFVKDADKEIIKLLKEKGRIVASEPYRHSYPFCWRSDTPLIYRAVPGTFIAVETFRDQLIANNKETYWVPTFVQEKRFHNWLENARDWAVSRNRFWGTPIPMWVSDDGEEVVVIGSKEELEKRCGQSIADLHRDFIDHITLPSAEGRGQLRRVDEVFDCWFESGSMPYAQQHYPFENKEQFEQSFPADFIAEGIDQTRGWFYTLMVLSTALFNKPAFKNLICNGLVLAEDGQKMSKRKQNYPPPEEIITKYGADALRLYLINSPVVRADDLRFKEAGVKQNLRDIFLPWYHGYRLFVMGASQQEKKTGERFVPDSARAHASTNTMDRWALAAVNSLVSFMRTEMEAYRLYTVVPRLVDLVETLTNWYIRMNRDRFSGERGADHRLDSLCTLFEVLLVLCRIMAPLTPFFCELMYQNLRKVIPDAPKSIHYMMIPQAKVVTPDDEKIVYDVSMMQQLIEKGRAIRDRHKLNMRIPLKQVLVVHSSQEKLDAFKALESEVLDELNVRSVRTALVSEVPELVTLKCLPNHKKLGARFGAAYKEVQAKIRRLTHAELAGLLSSGSIAIDGDEFLQEDLLVQLEYSGPKGQWDSDPLDGGLVLLHRLPTQEMLDEAAAREVCAYVQKMRKEAGMRKEDELEIHHACPSDSPLASVLEVWGDYVCGRLGRRLLPTVLRSSRAVSLLREDKEVRLHVLEGDNIEETKQPLMLELLRGYPFVHESELTKLLPEASDREAMHNYLHCLDIATLRAKLRDTDGRLCVVLNTQSVELELGKHFSLSYTDAMQADTAV